MKRKDLIKRYGAKSWAIVTGGSEGIGWEFCQQIAQMGFNVIIVARNQETLTKRENYLKELYPEQEFMTISADFSQSSTVEWYENFIKKLGDRDVSILVNNVGRMIGILSQNSDQDILDVFLTNTCPAVMLTKMMSEKMHYRDDRSAIINVGSQFCEFPSSTNSVYASSKAFIKNFTLGEGVNHKEKIDFLMAQPGFTQTAMMQGRSNWLLGSTPPESVNAFLNALGNTSQFCGHFKHEFGIWLIYVLTGILPYFAAHFIMDFVYYNILGFARGAKTLMEEPTSSNDRRKSLTQKVETMLSNCFTSKSVQAVPYVKSKTIE